MVNVTLFRALSVVWCDNRTADLADALVDNTPSKSKHHFRVSEPWSGLNALYQHNILEWTLTFIQVYILRNCLKDA